MKVRSQKMLQILGAVACSIILALPMAAQQEVNPDHFDQQPSAARSHKTALPGHKTQTVTNKRTGYHGANAVETKSKSQDSLVLKADAKTRLSSR